jgi:hypothetical protein
MLVKYIGTVLPVSRWRSGRPACIQIVAPIIGHVEHVVAFDAVGENPIARHVGADIDILAQHRQHRIARRRHADQRAGLRIELAETQEVVGIVGRQNRDVALHRARRHAGGDGTVLAGPDFGPRGLCRGRDVALAGQAGIGTDFGREHCW